MKLFNLNLRPMMDEDGGGLGGPAPLATEGATQTGVVTDGAIGTEGSQDEKVVTPTVTDPPSQKHPPELNAKFAEMRVKTDAAEKRANDAEAQRDAQRTSDREIAKKYGQYGVYSDADVSEKYGKSHGVNTVAEFEAALQKEQQDQEYKDKGIDPDAMNKLIENHPAIQAAKAQQGQAAIGTEISEFSAEYPDLNIKTLQDMQALPNFDAIKEKAYRGMTLLEAYESVNRAEIRKKNSDSAKQAALNSIQGKDHVRGNGNGVEGDTVRVPDDVMEMYKRFNPKQTTEQIKAHYKKSQK